ncbi:hypothetical protein [Tenacibaculum discolor]|uniref:hypothetical protein n=1 Tax=Tenacibaculum discolor TaxID=361581 RepID=UPI003F7A1986
MKKIVLIIAMLAIGVNTQAQSVITETAEGNVGIGTTTPKNKNETVAVPTVLHVKKVNTSGDVEVARFEGGNDSDNTAAIVRINHSNDRGLYLKGGRRNSDRSFGEIGIIGTSGNLETPSIIMNDTGEVSFTSHITSKRAGSNTFLRFNDYGYSGYGSATTLGSGANVLLYGKSASRADVIALRNSTGEKVTINANGNVGIGTTNPNEKLDVRGNLYINAGVNDNYIFWEGHNMTMGTKPGSYYHNVFSLKPGGSSQGKLYSRLQMFSANSESDYEKNVLINSGGNSYFNGGNVGIGTNSPLSSLHVEGTAPIITFKATNLGSGVRFNSIGQNGDLFRFQKDGYTKLTIKNSGSVGIGTSTTGAHRLAVDGSIGAREIKVEANSWSDFVFEKEYNLPTLAEVEKHIKEKGHLQNIPSAKEVEKNGFFLGAMDAKLLQKIEELTLYTIEQEKEIKKLKEAKKENNELKERLIKLEKLVQKLL